MAIPWRDRKEINVYDGDCQEPLLLLRELWIYVRILVQKSSNTLYKRYLRHPNDDCQPFKMPETVFCSTYNNIVRYNAPK